LAAKNGASLSRGGETGKTVAVIGSPIEVTWLELARAFPAQSTEHRR
jgi:hypothetical protein